MECLPERRFTSFYQYEGLIDCCKTESDNKVTGSS